MDSPFSVMFFCLDLHMKTFEMRPLIIVYLLRVSIRDTQLLKIPYGDSLVFRVTGKAWGGPDNMFTKTKAYLEPSLRGMRPLSSIS